MAAIDRLNSLASETTLAIKAPVAVATTGNITLSGIQTIDGVSVGNNSERVLVKDQTDQTTNNIYIASSGNWTLAQDAGGNTDWTAGTLVLVQRGSANTGVVFAQQTAAPVTIGTSNLVFAQQGSLTGSVASRTATATPVTITTTDRIVYIDTAAIAGAITVNLPPAATMVGLATLMIQDSTGSAATFNITINPNGSEKINKVLSSVKINGACGFYRLKPQAGGGWLIQ